MEAWYCVREWYIEKVWIKKSTEKYVWTEYFRRYPIDDDRNESYYREEFEQAKAIFISLRQKRLDCVRVEFQDAEIELAEAQNLTEDDIVDRSKR